jgi:hypothetical protein
MAPPPPLLLASLLWCSYLLFILFPLVLTSLLLASPHVPAVSFAAHDPSVAVILSAVNVTGVPAVASIFAVATAPVAVDVPSATGVFNDLLLA